ncbi:MAG: hypothetical protein KDB00_11800 [Planctomycetales bacterium]|nr:hypothetical protein [Planctomycetales bacterium]
MHRWPTPEALVHHGDGLDLAGNKLPMVLPADAQREDATIIRGESNRTDQSRRELSGSILVDNPAIRIPHRVSQLLTW